MIKKTEIVLCLLGICFSAAGIAFAKFGKEKQVGDCAICCLLSLAVAMLLHTIRMCSAFGAKYAIVVFAVSAAVVFAAKKLYELC